MRGQITFEETNNLSGNPPKRTAVASFVVALFAAVMIFVPGLIGIDGFNGGFAISFISLTVAITAAIVGIMYLGWAAKLDEILRGEGILAHWTYTPEYWAEYTKKEYEEEKSEKKGLFLIVSGFSLFFGILFWVLDAEAGFIVFLGMLGLIGLVAFVWRFSAWYNYKQNIDGVKEAFITKDAVYMNKKLYTWRTYFTRFDEVKQEDNHGLKLLVFKYTTTGRAGPQTYTTRVPIPLGQEEAAKNVVQQINLQN
jgi:uncharacterized membrane protein